MAKRSTIKGSLWKISGMRTVLSSSLVNKVSGGRGSIRADLVIAADGSASHVHQPLQPHLKHTHAGMNTFKLKTTLHATTHGYIALSVRLCYPFCYSFWHYYSYSIPYGNGTLEPGKLVSVRIRGLLLWWGKIPLGGLRIETTQI